MGLTKDETIESLNDDVLQNIAQYVAPKSFTLLAPVSRRFRDLYYVDDDDDEHEHNNNMMNKRFPRLSSLRYSIIKVEQVEKLYKQFSLSHNDLRKLIELREGIVRAIIQDKNPNLLDWVLQEEEKETPTQKHDKTLDRVILRRIVNEAAVSGYMDLIQRIDDSIRRNSTSDKNRDYIFASICNKAAANGHLNILKWARSHEQKFPWSSLTCALAAMNGNMDILEYAISNKCPYDVSLCVSAAKSGNLDLLQWAILEKKCPISGAICEVAASRGFLNIIQWMTHLTTTSRNVETRMNSFSSSLYNNNNNEEKRPCWNVRTCRAAARSGNLDVLKWVVQRGCPCDGTVIQEAMSNNQSHVVDWLHTRGFKQ